MWTQFEWIVHTLANTDRFGEGIPLHARLVMYGSTQYKSYVREREWQTAAGGTPNLNLALAMLFNVRCAILGDNDTFSVKVDDHDPISELKNQIRASLPIPFWRSQTPYSP